MNVIHQYAFIKKRSKYEVLSSLIWKSKVYIFNKIMKTHENEKFN